MAIITLIHSIVYWLFSVYDIGGKEIESLPCNLALKKTACFEMCWLVGSINKNQRTA